MMKWKRGKAKASVDPSENGIDRISSLPDPILHKILSCLENTEEIVRTSVLSRSWRYLWTSVPFLDIDVSPRLKTPKEFKKDKFREFVYWVLLNGSVDLVRFRLLSLNFCDMATVNRWIHAAVMRKVKSLDLCIHSCGDALINMPCACCLVICGDAEIVKLPSCLVTCESLEVLRLKLFGSSLSLPHYTGFAKLTVIELNNVGLSDGDLVGHFFESCPLLEDLSLIDCLISSLDVLRISCSKLKSLKLENVNLIEVCREARDEHEILCNVLQVSCPKLTYFKYLGHIADKFIFKNLDSLKQAVIYPEYMNLCDLFGDVTDVICRLFGGLCHAESLSLNHDFLECIDSQWNLEHFAVSLPNLKTLDVTTTMDEFGMTIIIDILERSPNLESLSLVIEEYCEREDWWVFQETTVESSKRLLASHLKRVEFLMSKGEEEVLALIHLLLEFGVVLEEMIFTWHYESDYHEKSTVIMEEVSKFPKASSNAKLVARCRPI